MTDWLAMAMIEDTLDRISFMQLAPKRALVVGPYAKRVELPAASDVHYRDWINEEQPIEGAPYDLIISMGRLDTVNDLPGALFHARNALAPEGVFIAQMLGAGSLSTLRDIMLKADGDRPAARIHPQIDNRAATGLLQRALFSKQVVDQYPLSVSYEHLGKLISDLREQGLTNQLANTPPQLTRANLERAQQAFEAAKDERGRVTESFEILTLTGWR